MSQYRTNLPERTESRQVLAEYCERLHDEVGQDPAVEEQQ